MIITNMVLDNLERASSIGVLITKNGIKLLGEKLQSIASSQQANDLSYASSRIYTSKDLELDPTIYGNTLINQIELYVIYSTPGITLTYKNVNLSLKDGVYTISFNSDNMLVVVGSPFSYYSATQIE